MSSSRLPAMLSTAMRAIRCLSDPDWCLSDLCNIISTDPAVVISLLKAANSTHRCRNRTCETLADAVLQLGKDVVVAVCLRSAIALDSMKPASGFDDVYSLYWTQSVLQALAAESLGCRIKEDTGTYFVAGLLADIGILVMLLADPDRYASLMRTGVSSGERQTTLESSVYGFNHVDVGVQMAASWGVSDQIVEAIRWQHVSIAEMLQVEQVSNSRLKAACFLAAQVAELYLGYKTSTAGLVIETVAGRHFETSLQELLAQTSGRINQQGPLFEVDPLQFSTVDELVTSAESLLSQLLSPQCCPTV